MLSLNHNVVRVATVVLTATLTACASITAGNLFSHYSQQNSALYQATKSGQYQQAQALLPQKSVAGDILDNFERGRVELLAGAYPQSKAAFEVSDQAIQAEQDKALISLSDSISSVGALAVNDNILEYSPTDYELGFLHLYLALNYLQRSDLEGALVEVRRANQVQERAKKIRDKQLNAAQIRMKQQGLSPNLGSILSRYPDAGDSLKAVQNGYLLFLSGLLYETEGDLNSAYIDYTRALAVAPNNRAIVDATIRVATRSARSDDLARLIKQYGKSSQMQKGQGRVIVIEEQSVVSAMQAWKLTLPIYDSRGNGALYSVALPYYPNSAVNSTSSIAINGELVRGDLLVNVDLMAQQQLTENLPAVILRQALRVYTKDRLRKEATNGEDDVGNLLFNVWNTLTEQPDTRSWQTLPQAAYSSSSLINAGTHKAVVAGKSYTFEVREGQTTLVWVSTQGNNATIWHKQLGRL